ncbi:Oidioi.mRNA.OKI2018_I69.PAR.g8973.t1.cds [Oikopleura dioica]|uniref:Oidioi.mRNA.OKI2018_I69.PAR.g8973.t1.cds n=1 Tax=Oikopleura dioica TaxID=34765 RepID=A0ABN7RLW2_OIKDI|nr:Oidioi.mRNA.OKI2018_I69.PAR.g8973.t1.cds [Oikopleura dioica]
MNEIWLLEENWNLIGTLLQPMYGGSSILIEESSVYLFPGNNRDDARAIQRITIDGNDVTKIEVVGYHSKYTRSPIIFVSPLNLCSV